MKSRHRFPLPNRFPKSHREAREALKNRQEIGSGGALPGLPKKGRWEARKNLHQNRASQSSRSSRPYGDRNPVGNLPGIPGGRRRDEGDECQAVRDRTARRSSINRSTTRARARPLPDDPDIDPGLCEHYARACARETGRRERPAAGALRAAHCPKRIRSPWMRQTRLGTFAPPSPARSASTVTAGPAMRRNQYAHARARRAASTIRNLLKPHKASERHEQ